MGTEFKCDFCDLQFETRRSRGAHLAKKHPGQVRAVRPVRESKAIVVDSLSQLQGAIKKTLDGGVIGVMVVTIEDWQEKSDKAHKWDKVVTVAPSLEGILKLIKDQK
jgi:hypothetical protein